MKTYEPVDPNEMEAARLVYEQVKAHYEALKERRRLYEWSINPLTKIALGDGEILIAFNDYDDYKGVFVVNGVQSPKTEALNNFYWGCPFVVWRNVDNKPVEGWRFVQKAFPHPEYEETVE